MRTTTTAMRRIADEIAELTSSVQDHHSELTLFERFFENEDAPTLPYQKARQLHCLKRSMEQISYRISALRRHITAEFESEE